MGLIRLQKYLAEAGVCSRRKGEAHIRAGRVSVNGRAVTELGVKVDPETDQVAFDGRPVRPAEKKVYIALNKPQGYITSCRQPGRELVVDLIDLPMRLFPVGRLDADSCGLLLMTNDGRIHHRLAHPSFDHAKHYVVTVDSPIADGALAKLARGVRLDGRPTRQAEVVRLDPRRFRIVLKEGRNRQIRRMVAKVGRQVVKLKRTQMANIRLGRLPSGRWRHLSSTEVAALLEALGLPK
ncbi:MAG: pseudouridine synthase [Desulfosarcinaceae bacterium]|jgi:23S rRNA pseudouridine2605 synthase/23S rRNA pseudouridine2604 synthase